MASAAKTSRITPEDYLARERLAEFKSEFYDGQVWPLGEPIRGMAGTTRVHNLIAGNLFREISLQLKDRPCEAYIGDIRVRERSSDSYTYPDIVAVCGGPYFEDDHFDTLTNPDVIVEVLSPSTEAWDRGGKFEYYRRFLSLKEYCLVSQDRILVERFVRQGEGWMLVIHNQIEGRLAIQAISCEIPLREVYRNVTFDPLA